ncbi:MAG TPA: hemerythrin domain-containing protein [Cerasibacillus sp.]|uniref:hemerythrin domain-containing protein n=1 Tax=Cerasibacillus sp. TaxID=2498711 RepID=UPI002F3E964A
MSQATFTFNLPILRLLENEHQYLTYVMNQWHPIVLGFERNQYSVKEGRQAVKELRQQIIQFMEPLKNHMEKEEAYLFPAIAKYIGNEQGPILAVEEEHEEIDAYLNHFLHHSRESLQDLRLQDMKQLVQDAGEAFEIITIHFVKEQSIVFPMVRDMLNKEEQDKLMNQLYTPILSLRDLI